MEVVLVQSLSDIVTTLGTRQKIEGQNSHNIRFLPQGGTHNIQ